MDPWIPWRLKGLVTTRLFRSKRSGRYWIYSGVGELGAGNGWLEDECFLSFWGFGAYFQGCLLLVSGRVYIFWKNMERKKDAGGGMMCFGIVFFVLVSDFLVFSKLGVLAAFFWGGWSRWMRSPSCLMCDFSSLTVNVLTKCGENMQASKNRSLRGTLSEICNYATSVHPWKLTAGSPENDGFQKKESPFSRGPPSIFQGVFSLTSFFKRDMQKYQNLLTISDPHLPRFRPTEASVGWKEEGPSQKGWTPGGPGRPSVCDQEMCVNVVVFKPRSM